MLNVVVPSAEATDSVALYKVSLRIHHCIKCIVHCIGNTRSKVQHEQQRVVKDSSGNNSSHNGSDAGRAATRHTNSNIDLQKDSTAVVNKLRRKYMTACSRQHEMLHGGSGMPSELTSEGCLQS